MTKKQLAAAIKDTEGINSKNYSFTRLNAKNILLLSALALLLLMLGDYAYTRYLSGVSW
jgi:hypothetical protein